MRGKNARELRKMLELKKEGYYDSQLVEVPGKTRRVGVIDGVNGNHRIEDRGVYLHVTNPDRKLYRRLKKAFTHSNNELNKEVKKDFSSLKSQKS